MNQDQPAGGTGTASTVVTYYGDILPLFRPMDIQCMRNPDFNVLLASYSWMSSPDNAQLVHDHLAGDLEPRMPYGGPYWSDENIALFKAWMDGGYQEGIPPQS